MSIRCLAEDYIVKESQEAYYVYSGIYEGASGFIFLSFLLNLFVPEASDYYIPLSIEIKKNEEDVLVKKNLTVEGSSEYQYFVAKHHMEKWKKTACVMKNLLWIAGFLLNFGFVFLFLKNDNNVYLGICELVVFFLTLGAVLKLEIKNKKRRKYDVREIFF